MKTRATPGDGDFFEIPTTFVWLFAWDIITIVEVFMFSRVGGYFQLLFFIQVEIPTLFAKGTFYDATYESETCGL